MTRKELLRLSGLLQCYGIRISIVDMTYRIKSTKTSDIEAVQKVCSLALSDDSPLDRVAASAALYLEGQSVQNVGNEEHPQFV